jgi:hypothetical protein
MSEPFYTAVATVTKADGLRRRAEIAVGPPLEFGVHGPIKQHYRLEGAPDLPLPVDYIVAATGG